MANPLTTPCAYSRVRWDGEAERGPEGQSRAKVPLPVLLLSLYDVRLNSPSKITC
jgi:hypothetical protein